MRTSKFSVRKKGGYGAFRETHPFSIHETDFEGDDAVAVRHICCFWGTRAKATAARIAKILNSSQKLKGENATLRDRLRHGDGVARMVNRNLAAKVKLLEAEVQTLLDARREDIEARIAESVGSDPGDDPDYAGY